MTLLPDHVLANLVDQGHMYVTDGPAIDLETQLGPSSFDLRLGYQFKILNRRNVRLIDTKQMDEYYANVEIEEHTAVDGVVIHPGEFMLGSTLEHVAMPKDMAARVEGRSSYGRLGLIIHSTAGFIDAGFEGQITLEIQNIGSVPIRIYPEDRICQIVFQELTESPTTPYSEKPDTKYHRQTGVRESRINIEHRPHDLI